MTLTDQQIDEAFARFDCPGPDKCTKTRATSAHKSDMYPERVARIIDPDAWALREALRGDRQLEERIADSESKARAAITALAEHFDERGHLQTVAALRAALEQKP